ncbi:hypothetical protein J6590_012257 [Homalodisca vitripennis]|nr:hypothetical protein J6590_012257 [Homalodisca vitripennis]
MSVGRCRRGGGIVGNWTILSRAETRLQLKCVRVARSGPPLPAAAVTERGGVHGVMSTINSPYSNHLVAVTAALIESAGCFAPSTSLAAGDVMLDWAAGVAPCVV